MNTFKDHKQKFEKEINFLRTKGKDNYISIKSVFDRLGFEERNIHSSKIKTIMKIIKDNQDFFTKKFENNIKTIIKNYKSQSFSDYTTSSNFWADICECLLSVEEIIDTKKYPTETYLYSTFFYIAYHTTLNNLNSDVKWNLSSFRLDNANCSSCHTYDFEPSDLKDVMLSEVDCYVKFRTFLIENKECFALPFQKNMEKYLKQRQNASNISIIEDGFTSQVFISSLESIIKLNDKKKYLKDTISIIEGKNKTIPTLNSLCFILSDIDKNNVEMDEISMKFLTNKILNYICKFSINDIKDNEVLNSIENIDTILGKYLSLYVEDSVFNTKLDKEYNILSFYYILKNTQCSFKDNLTKNIREGICMNLNNSQYYKYNVEVDVNDKIIEELSNRYLEQELSLI